MEPTSDDGAPGPNGAGKTTIRILMGMRVADGGAIEIFAPLRP